MSDKGSKNNKVDKSVKKIDTIITGLIIGGALSGIIGAAKTKKGKKIKNKLSEKSKNGAKKGLLFFGKGVAGIVGIFNNKNKK